VADRWEEEPPGRWGEPTGRTGADAPSAAGQPATGQEPSVKELVQQLSDQTSTLIRQELRLAQLELQEKGKRAGIGAGLFGGAGLVALYAVGALIATLILLLGTALEPWIAALIVAAVLGGAAGALALSGKKQVEQATPPVPEQAQEEVQEDVETVKRRAKRGKERQSSLRERMRG
jgi:uncharacterized membrane protein YqjE